MLSVLVSVNLAKGEGGEVGDVWQSYRVPKVLTMWWDLVYKCNWEQQASVLKRGSHRQIQT